MSTSSPQRLTTRLFGGGPRVQDDDADVVRLQNPSSPRRTNVKTHLLTEERSSDSGYAELETPGQTAAASAPARRSGSGGGGGARSTGPASSPPSPPPPPLPSAGDDLLDEYKQDLREVYFNYAPGNAVFDKCTNVIVTSKYTVVTFLFKFLYESFTKVANFFFLVVCILQTIKEISNTYGYPTNAPVLFFVISIDACFAIMEDLRRHRSDHEANSAVCHIVRNGQVEDRLWSQVKVGDFLQIRNREVIPADVLILAVSEPVGEAASGICYVETKSLDGETNLKLRQAIPATMSVVVNPQELMLLRGVVKCEQPNPYINKFAGKVEVIPISLYVSMTSVKFLQARFIAWDKHMYHADTDTPAIVRTMELNEELGQISYVFSDKTGTLTCNIMEFRKCSIGGVSYGSGITEIGRAALVRAGKPIPPEPKLDQGVKKMPFVNFVDPALFDAMKNGQGETQKQRILQFFEHLAVCHTVIPEKLESGEIRLSASSPDEQALVAGAAFVGFSFESRSVGKATINVFGERQVFDVLEVLEFNSTRKRMSVVVRRPNGELFLYSKGADMMIYQRLKDDPAMEGIKRITRDHMEKYADDGLRTLALAVKKLDEKWPSDFETYQLGPNGVVVRPENEDEAFDAALTVPGSQISDSALVSDSFSASVYSNSIHNDPNQAIWEKMPANARFKASLSRRNTGYAFSCDEETTLAESYIASNSLPRSDALPAALRNSMNRHDIQ
ncbi:hypothetical protein P43SY_006032 [Pythium insidiosum]|uniref:P-type ATPase N-terminal domain-containing protein n=1 Tax=Pythium insidiosum TaxID=114742 RepID=A0AAD5LKI4_PYTIN|nr:hypothetical protein P43SY_006032 [Pythium insidiosum]